VTDYVREFKRNWRPLASAAIGMAAGIGINAYVASLFAPHLIKEFGWSKADFAFVGATSVVALIMAPVVGRIVDAFGTRAVALIGVLMLPLCYIGNTLITGPIWQFIALTVATSVFGITTASFVYTRVVAACFDRARGLALALVVSGAPLAGAAMAIVLNIVIETWGWRAGYYTLAGYIAVFGSIALLLMPSTAPARKVPGPVGVKQTISYREIARRPAFWLIVGGMLLCNVQQPLHSPQLGLVLVDSGASLSLAAALVSLYAIGVLVGRIICGAALDRWKPHLVAAGVMGLPAIGLIILGMHTSSPALLALSVLLIGLSQGGEGDVAAFMVARHFGVSAYSSILGIVVSTIAVSSALGSLILGLSLKASDSYTLFAIFSAVMALLGCTLFARLGSQSPRPSAHKLEVPLHSEVPQPGA
jgi:MFS family permease